MKMNILVVDDDDGVLSALKLLLKSEGFNPVAVGSPEAALARLRSQEYDFILMDLNYTLDTTSGEDGFKLIASIREVDEYIPIIVMTGWGSIEVAVNAMKCGANDFIQKPWGNDRLLTIIHNQMRLATIQHQSQRLFRKNQILQELVAPGTDIIIESDAGKRVLETLRQVASSDASVLLTGENGTGKSMFAKFIHDSSARNKAEFISVNMGAVAESLFESEMFGHVKGAFTDAHSSRIGRFELADEGTLFLDEISNTSYAHQGKLLRVLEDSQFEKVGSSKTQTVDFRLITATNANLQSSVASGGFRKDLLYRINTIEVEIPPLRERAEDVVPLARAFLQKASKKYAREILAIDLAAQDALLNYDWPGNIRELGHVIERAYILCRGESIKAKDLRLGNMIPVEHHSTINANNLSDSRSLKEIEIDIIDQRLAYFDGDVVNAARSLNISRSAFYRRLGKTKE